MGPWHVPWSTFLAFVVAGASVVIALVWAALDRRRDRDASDHTPRGMR